LIRWFFSGTLVAMLACAGRTLSPPPPKTDITVSAAISLKDVLEEITHLYGAVKPEVTVHLNLGASGTLQQQIEQGAPVDVFISASPAQMDDLAAHKLILPGSRQNLVKNSVVLIVPKGRADIISFQDLTRSSVKLISIGDPQSVPAGKYAQEVLTHLGLFERLRPKFAFAKDVRGVLTYVETDNADAGVVYATDARRSTRVSIAATAPEDSHSPVIYPVAVVSGSKNAQAAKSFEDFLLGSRCAAVFEKFGFRPAGK
jgi:molybdate transport system substrate-binding protein